MLNAGATGQPEGEAVVDAAEPLLPPNPPPPQRRISRLPSIAQTGITVFPSLVSDLPTKLFLEPNAQNKCYTATTIPNPDLPNQPRIQLTVDQSGRFSRTLVFYAHNPSDKSVSKLCSLVRDTLHLTAGKHYKVEDPKSAKTLIAIEVSSSGAAEVRVLNSFITFGEGSKSHAVHEPRRLRYVPTQAGQLGGEIEYSDKAVAAIEKTNGERKGYTLTLAPKLDAFVAVLLLNNTWPKYFVYVTPRMI